VTVVRDRETANGSDGPMLRRARLRLAAWSGGATLATLIVLGIALYLGLSAALSGSSAAQLEEHAESVTRLIGEADDEALERILGADPDSEEDFGRPEFGGAAAGLLTILVSPSNDVIGALPDDLGRALPVQASVDLARTGESRVGDATLNDTPVRVLSEAVVIDDAMWVVQVIQDRTNEQRVLDTALFVLIAGGIAVLLASVTFGFLYAGRALVPIRESLRRQREFAADASHELRTPIAVIKATAEEMRRSQRGDGPLVETSIADLEAEADHLTQLVDDLLVLARADSGRLEMRREATDLADAAGEALHSLARRAQAGTVTLRLDASPSPVTGDPDRLRQLIGIIVDNAIQHSREGGIVNVEVRPDGKRVIATIRDTGPGIRPDDMPRLYERFWRAADAPYAGTGLGLAIARTIASQHGGSIMASNARDGGANFEVRLPLRGTSSRRQG
jgi:signal transduction histidine kinase